MDIKGTMDIRGLLLANSENSGAAAAAPLATLDVAGKSTLQRMAERLQQYGISQVSAVVEDAPSVDQRNFGLPSDVACISAAPDRFWRTAENAFNEMAQSGAELVVLVRLGAYIEADLEKFVQFHIDRGGRVTQLASGGIDMKLHELFQISFNIS